MQILSTKSCLVKSTVLLRLGEHEIENVFYLILPSLGPTNLAEPSLVSYIKLAVILLVSLVLLS